MWSYSHANRQAVIYVNNPTDMQSDMQAAKQIGKYTYRQIGGHQTGMQAIRHACLNTCRQFYGQAGIQASKANIYAGRQVGRKTEIRADKQTGRPSHRQADRQSFSHAGCHNTQSMD